MKILGHPVHAMLIHFPVALWTTHAFLHAFAGRLPAGDAAVSGFWILAAGTGLGWAAACFGAADLLDIAAGGGKRLRTGLLHGAVNGSVLCGFTAILVLEYSRYPAIAHGWGFLSLEFGLLGAMGVGNALGGSLVWPREGA
ncbi:MAG TPA: DUF2231 domain-containing protein [Opitutaceae bacterium]